MSLDVGSHLKAVRQMYGLSQRELAKRAGVTNGLISLIEQNRVSPSVSSLKKVLDGIPMALADFFTLDLGAQPQVFFPREELSGTPIISKAPCRTASATSGARNASSSAPARRRPFNPLIKAAYRRPSGSIGIQ